MHLLALPAMADNYIWMLHNGREAAVCDPGDAAPVISVLQQRGLALAAILITHHHADHVGGVDALYQQCGDQATQVYLPDADGLADATFPSVPPRAIQRCVQDQVLQIFGLNFVVLDVPGHTAGHIAFFAQRQPRLQLPFVLCGDTLFSAGCGRIFEGTPAQMLASLQKIAVLPDETRVCCAHEYTLSNLRFAQAVEPENVDIKAYIERCEALRARQQPTLPSTLQQEKTINPFLRVHIPAVQASALQRDSLASSPLAVFTALRIWKNQF